MKLEDVQPTEKEIAKRDRAGSFRRRGSDRRFYSQRDMAIIKRDDSFKNSQINRGVIPDLPNNGIHVCGCGATGCFIHTSSDNSGLNRSNAPVNMYVNEERNK